MIRYTEQERKLILNRELSPQRLSNLLGRSAHAISQERQRLRRKFGIREGGQIYRGRFRNHWSKDEDYYLRENYWRQDVTVTAKELERSPQCVRVRASKLGIRRQGDSYFNAKRFGQIMGVSPTTARKWINRGLLSASKGDKNAGPHKVWVIQPSELLRFLRMHKEAYDPNRVKHKFPNIIGDYLPVKEAVEYCGYTRSGLTQLARKGMLVAYKGFGPAGHPRWYFARASLDSLDKTCPACQRPIDRRRKYCSSHECYLIMRRRYYHALRAKASPRETRVKIEVVAGKAKASLVYI